MHHKYKVAMKQFGSLCLMLSAVSLAGCSNSSDGDEAAGDTYSVDGYTSLVHFKRAEQGAAWDTTAISGLAAGEKILAIKFHPTAGTLVGLSDASKLYTIDPATAAASLLMVMNTGDAAKTPYFTTAQLAPLTVYTTTVVGATTTTTQAENASFRLTTDSYTTTSTLHTVTQGLDFDIDPVIATGSTAPTSLRITVRNRDAQVDTPVITNNSFITNLSTGEKTLVGTSNFTQAQATRAVITAPFYNVALATGAVVKGQGTSTANCNVPASSGVCPYTVNSGGTITGFDASAFTASAPGACRAKSKLYAIDLDSAAVSQMDIDTGGAAGNGTTTIALSLQGLTPGKVFNAAGLDIVTDANGVDSAYALLQYDGQNADFWAIYKIDLSNGVVQFLRNLPSTFQGLAVPPQADARAPSC